MTVTQHLLLFAVCAIGAYPTLLASELWTRIGLSEAEHGNAWRVHLCLALHYLAGALSAILLFGGRRPRRVRPRIAEIGKGRSRT